MSLLEVRDLTLRFGAITAFEGVSFDVERGELFAVIGPNGAGKSSLFNALSRVYEPDAGSVRLDGRDFLRVRRDRLAALGVARSFQNLGVFPHLTALENVLVGRHHLMRCGVLRGGLGLAGARSAGTAPPRSRRSSSSGSPSTPAPRCSSSPTGTASASSSRAASRWSRG